jgi:hypothetical protein
MCCFVLITETKEQQKVVKYQSIITGRDFEEDRRVKPFLPGEFAVITEKLDGTNASFHQPEPETLLRYSRIEQLSADNDLRGFYAFIKEKLLGKKLNPMFRYYGEWLVSHKVAYPEGFMKQFYLFDIQNVESGEYQPFLEVRKASIELNLPLAPVLFEGRLPDTQEAVDALIHSFIGKTDMGASLLSRKTGLQHVGEGVVARNESRKRPDGKRIIAKYVVAEMAESKWNRVYKEPKNVKESEYVSVHVTNNRIEKMLMKFVDEGILPEEWALNEAKAHLPYLVERVVTDVLQEQPIPESFEEEMIIKLVKKRTGALAFPLLLANQTKN